jgi:hypothetical protein
VSRLAGLFSAGTSFAVRGENVVGPYVAASACAIAGADGSTAGAIPVLRRVGDSPNVSGVVERHAYEKLFSIVTQRQATCHASGSACAAGKVAQQNWGFEGQGLRCAESAALRAHYDSVTGGGKLVPSVHAGHSYRNLDPHSGAAPRDSRGQNFHGQTFMGAPLRGLNLLV